MPGSYSGAQCQGKKGTGSSIWTSENLTVRREALHSFPGEVVECPSSDSKAVWTRQPSEDFSSLNQGEILNQDVVLSLLPPHPLTVGAVTRTDAVHSPHFCCEHHVTVEGRWLGCTSSTLQQTLGRAVCNL